MRTSKLTLLLAASLCLGPLRLDSAGLVYTKAFGGTSMDAGYAVAADAQGNAYVAGSTASLNFPAVNALQPRNGGASFLMSADEGKSWDAPPVDAAIYSLTPAGASLYAATSNGIYRSGDSGRSWTRVSPELNFAIYDLWADPRTPARLVAASVRGILISEDAGVTWVESNQGIELGAGVYSIIRTTAIASPAGRPDTLFAADGGTGSLYRSLDSGRTWAKLDLAPSPVPVSAVVADPARPDTLFAGVAGSGVFKTTDGGNTWRNVAGISMSYGPHTIAIAPGRIYAARTDGISISTDGGETWRNSGLAGMEVRAMAADPNHASVAWALASGAIYRTTNSGASWARVGPLVPARLQNIAVLAGTVMVSGDPGQDAFLTKWDPAGSRILFSTYLGGRGADYARGVALDAAGNIWVVGDTSSPDFPVTNQSRLTGEQNAFVAKISADGSRLLYASYLGGGIWESVSALAVDSGGAVYIAGYTESTDFPVTAGAVQSSYRSGCTDPPVPGYTARPNRGDAFVVKLRSGGEVEYATYLGGSCGDTASGIAVDSSGSSYIVGFTTSADFPTTAGAMQPAYGGGPNDGYIAKLNPGGTALVYSTFLGGTGADSVSAVTVDSTGAAYVSGNSSMFLSPGDRFSSCHGASLGTGHGLGFSLDGGVFVAKVVSDGSARVFGRPTGGFGCTQSASIALDDSANIWIAGGGGSTLPMVSPFQAFGLGEGFLTQMDPGAESILFSTLTDGSGEMAFDPAGNIYVAGYNYLGDIPKELAAGQVRWPSAAVTKVDPARTYPLRLDTPAKAGQSARRPSPLPPEGVAPGQVLRLLGRGLGPATPASTVPDASGVFPKTLADVQVRFDGQPAVLLSAGDTEIVCIVPFGVAGQQSSTIQVLYDSAESNPVAVPVTPVSLEIFAVVNPDGSLNSHDKPAPAGSFITIFVSGLGLTEPPQPDGRPNLGPGRMLNPLSATLNGAPAQILYAGPAPGLVAGVGQVNIALPPSAGSGSLSLGLESGQSRESLIVNIR